MNIHDYLKEKDRILSRQPVSYLVYAWRGEIRVKAGRRIPGDKTFHPIEGAAWHTHVPVEELTLRRGRVWVTNKEDIPCAVKMIQEYYRERITVIHTKYQTAIANAESISGD